MIEKIDYINQYAGLKYFCCKNWIIGRNPVILGKIAHLLRVFTQQETSGLPDFQPGNLDISFLGSRPIKPFTAFLNGRG